MQAQNGDFAFSLHVKQKKQICHIFYLNNGTARVYSEQVQSVSGVSHSGVHHRRAAFSHTINTYMMIGVRESRVFLLAYQAI